MGQAMFLSARNMKNNIQIKFVKVVDPRKLDLRQKKIILLSRKAILYYWKAILKEKRLISMKKIWNTEK